jgi:hypothetical protein
VYQRAYILRLFIDTATNNLLFLYFYYGFYIIHYTVNYRISTVNYRISTVNYRISTVNYRISTVNYRISTVVLTKKVALLMEVCPRSKDVIK